MITTLGPSVGVAAVVDWEMGAIGDPRADLGDLLATYSHGEKPPPVMELSPVTRLDGFPDRRDLVELYAARSGRAIAGLAWFEVLALWKSTIFLEAIYARYVRGEMGEDTFAASLERGVPGIADVASAMTEAVAGSE